MSANLETRLKLIPREQLWGFFIEGLLFIMFFAAMLFMATLRTPASNWAMIPHLLCNFGLLLLLAKHYFENRPALYWSHFDAVVIVLIIYFLANIYYSEIRAVSWRLAALYLDAFAAFFFGRLLFYHRLRAYVGVLIVTLGFVFVLAFILHSRLNLETDFATIQQLERVMRVSAFMGIFWAISFPFLLARKPSNLLFLLYAAILLTVYAMILTRRLGWVFFEATSSEAIQMRHEKFLTLQTALRILQNYPIFGSGLGTFPTLFEAYKQSPTVPYATGFNAYLYCAVELGVFGLVLFLYFLIRFPLHILRRWRLFPNRRLRMAIFVFFFFVVTIFLQGLYDPDMFSPGAWFLIWANIGVLMSLVMIRDPVRIFEAPFFGSRHFRSALSGSPGWSGRYTRAGEEPNKFARGGGGRSVMFDWLMSGRMVVLILSAVVLFVLTAAEAAPYVAATMARKRETEQIESKEYGERVQKAIGIFPLLSKLWSTLANHYQRDVASGLEIFTQVERIEQAYLRAIELNPYDPRNYEQLAFLYTDTNNAKKAVEILKRGVQNNPNHFVLRLLLVRELTRAGSLALATYHLRQALFRIAPERVELHLELAELYELRGLRDEARLHYKYALQVVPDTPEMNARLRRLRARLMTGARTSRPVTRQQEEPRGARIESSPR